MENLDNDVLENILFKLPLGTASSQAKRVCRSWKTILDDRFRKEVVGFLFACTYYNDVYRDGKITLYFGEEYDHIDIGNKMMKKYYYSRETLMEMEHCRFTFTSFQSDILVGSCNGLVCFAKQDPANYIHEPFAICNPLIGEFVFLKPNFSGVRKKAWLVSSGFGYCQSTGEYKVVRLYCISEEQRVSYAQVYTIGSNEWRDMETCIMNHSFSSTGIFANGVLHWLDTICHKIIVFDLEDEEFVELPLPPSEVLKHQKSHKNLNLLRGNLCWVQSQYEPYSIDIWAYKIRNHNTCSTRNDTEEYDHKRDYYNGNSWNWVKEIFSIELESNLEPFDILKSNQVLLLGDESFHCYEPKMHTVNRLGDDNDMDCWCMQAIPHTNSYVSLKHSGETWYGPGCSAVPQTNSSVLLTVVTDAYRRSDFLGCTAKF